MHEVACWKDYTDPEVQEELKVAYKTSAMANGGVGISLMYNDEEIVVPVEHVMAMINQGCSSEWC